MCIQTPGLIALNLTLLACSVYTEKRSPRNWFLRVCHSGNVYNIELDHRIYGSFRQLSSSLFHAGPYSSLS